MKNFMRLFTAVVLVLFATTAGAQDKTDIFNPVNTSVTSQMIAPDARAAGMGDVGVATDPDVNSQYWNPAKYPFCISRAGVSLNYTPWLRQLVSDMSVMTYHPCSVPYQRCQIRFRSVSSLQTIVRRGEYHASLCSV